MGTRYAALLEDWAAVMENRREPRYATRLAGALLTYRHRDEILVENVSRSGALVTGADLPERGTEVVLSAGAMEIVATVAWATDQSCGLMFHRNIDAGALRHLRQAG
ncbi:PilZ domain-containing protein [Sphingomonas jatrophae]|uniref:PilZ domain-containing protein n=1 Tax=Sphingomonas jatrophae TaxID=1166337 RepID=A0A1I6L9W8_9SPHN|nr:PilZ domain-containing protein [Sphingomonas jatrophae]SFS00286.1 hypothetical protein SAMN05192580_2493 [Sphingomonas jatrophae]